MPSLADTIKEYINLDNKLNDIISAFGEDGEHFNVDIYGERFNIFIINSNN